VVRKVKKSRKGKAKETDGTKVRSGKRKQKDDDPRNACTALEPETETVEEREERERQKAERLERMRDDPYYIVDDRSFKPPPLNDVDSIPVVRLDDLPPMPKDDPRLPSLRDPPDRLASQLFVVEKEGEMPQGSTPIPFESRTSSPLPTSSASPYTTVDDLHSGTPEPIKVMRSKKKRFRAGYGQEETDSKTGGRKWNCNANLISCVTWYHCKMLYSYDKKQRTDTNTAGKY